MNNDQLRSLWTELSSWYLGTVEISTAIYGTLIPMLKLKSATKVADAGCGSGNGVEILRLTLPETVEIHANDLTEAFIDVAKSKNHQNTRYIVCSNDELPYADNTFDRYVANLSLHIVPDPAKMITEAYRVLMQNGIAAFSVWGRQENSTLHSYMNSAIDEVFGPTVERKRSLFHLNNPSSLKSMIKSAGFSRVLTYFTISPAGMGSLEEALEFFLNMPTIIKLVNHEKYNQFVQVFREKLEQAFAREETINFECLVAIAYKE